MWGIGNKQVFKVGPIVVEGHSLNRQRILLETTIKDLCEESDRLGYEAEKVKTRVDETDGNQI